MKNLRITPVIVCLAFLSNTIFPGLTWSQDFYLPAPGAMVHLSTKFDPPILKGIKVNPDNPFRFDFILDKGDGALSNEQLKDESNRMIKYFLAGLTTPENDLWVNLSPYEKDRIIPQSFGLTEMGRDLLAEDYMLKQITATLIYPEDSTGKKFWKRIYEEAAKRFGTTNIPVNTFNKVWIVPQKAVVYENANAATAYVVESKLKVMLEQDYLALSKGTSITASKDVNSLGSQIVREVVLPELTKEVNEGRNFAPLRQVYNSLILATWYKKKIKDGILSRVYADKNKVIGINIDDPKEEQRIYRKYLTAFKKGVYNYIKEEIDPISQQSIPRKYFSGGVALHELSSKAMTVTHSRGLASRIFSTGLMMITASLLIFPLMSHHASAQSINLTGAFSFSTISQVITNGNQTIWTFPDGNVTYTGSASLTGTPTVVTGSNGTKDNVVSIVSGGIGGAGTEVTLVPTLSGPNQSPGQNQLRVTLDTPLYPISYGVNNINAFSTNKNEAINNSSAGSGYLGTIFLGTALPGASGVPLLLSTPDYKQPGSATSFSAYFWAFPQANGNVFLNEMSAREFTSGITASAMPYRYSPTIQSGAGLATIKIGPITFEAPPVELPGGSAGGAPYSALSPVFVAINSGIDNGVKVHVGELFAASYNNLTAPPTLYPILGSDRLTFMADDKSLAQSLQKIVGQENIHHPNNAYPSPMNYGDFKYGRVNNPNGRFHWGGMDVPHKVVPSVPIINTLIPTAPAPQGTAFARPPMSQHRPANWGIALGAVAFTAGVVITFDHVVHWQLGGGNAPIDRAMQTPKNGGIDLTPNRLNLELQNAGKEIKFNVNPAMLAQLRNVPGFTSVIIGMQAMTELSLKEFLGV